MEVIEEARKEEQMKGIGKEIEKTKGVKEKDVVDERKGVRNSGGRQDERVGGISGIGEHDTAGKSAGQGGWARRGGRGEQGRQLVYHPLSTSV